MSNYNSLNVVQGVLTKEWKDCELPLCTTDNDLTAGMKMLSKIAVSEYHTIPVDDTTSSSHLSGSRVSPELTLPSDLVEKIKIFVRTTAFTFRKVCQTGFPFSRLEGTASEDALKQTLKYTDSILFHFLMSENFGWLSSEELDSRIGDAFINLKFKEIQNACFALKGAYVQKGVNRAGYYLLWLIKYAAGCSYEMPAIESFTGSTVAEVLSQFVTGGESSSVKNPDKLIEILRFLNSKYDEFLFHGFLDKNSISCFFNFLIETLHCIPMDEWPAKSAIITVFFERMSFDSRRDVAKHIASSNDEKTANIGNHLFEGLQAASLREAAPHFYALVELLPQSEHSQIEHILGRPFNEFYHNSSRDPSFARRLNFNSDRFDNTSKVFTCGSLMIGVTTIVTCALPFLLAYDMTTEKLVWGIPLQPTSFDNSSLPKTYDVFNLEFTGDMIYLQFLGNKQVHLIDPTTGEFIATIETPKAPKDKYHYLHISSKGLTYQMVPTERTGFNNLIGGSISNGKWIKSFEVKPPFNSVCPLSTHVGSLRQGINRLTLVGPVGAQVTIENVLAAEARGDKLYLIERDPDHENKCFLTVRTLKDTNEVVSKVEKTIVLNTKTADFVELCDNGQWVLFTINPLEAKSPIFVDLASEKVTYSDHKIYSVSNSVVHTASGELWYWDYFSDKVRKVSPTGSTFMGILKVGTDSSTFRHVENDRLYFT